MLRCIEEIENGLQVYSPIIHNSNFCLPFPEMHASSEEIEKSAIKERRNRFRNGRAAAGLLLKMASAIEAVVMGIGLAFADSGEKRKFGGFLMPAKDVFSLFAQKLKLSVCTFSCSKDFSRLCNEAKEASVL